MKKRKLLLALIVLILLVNTNAQITRTEERIERGLNWEKSINIDKTKTLKVYPGIINFFNGTDVINLNTTLNKSSDPLFNYAVENGFYKAFFKEDPTSGQVVKYVKDNVETTFQPMALNYRNALNMIEQISMPKGVKGTPQKNNFIYPNIYGAGLSLQYLYLPTSLKEELVIDSFSSLPVPSKFITDQVNETLDLDFVFATNAQKIIIERSEWDMKTEIITSSIEIKDSSGNLLYSFSNPIAYDSSGEIQQLTFQLKKSGSSLFISVKIPYSWLNDTSRVYPIFIDPSLSIQGTNGGGDAYIASGGPNQNFGDLSELQTRLSSPTRHSYLMFNISSIPPNQKIDNATLCLYLFDDQSGADQIYAHHVYNTTWCEGNGGTDNNPACEITWNNQPCGTNFDNANQCNLTSESFTSNDANQDNTWQCWKVKDMLQKSYSENDNKIAIAIRTNISGNADRFRSKEYADSTFWPFLNITYSDADALPPELRIISPINQTYTLSAINFNITLNENASKAWYTLNNGINNITMTRINDTNFGHINTSIADGFYVAKFYANDTLGNLNSTESISFNINTTAAQIAYNPPTENSGVFKSKNSIEINVTGIINPLLDTLVIRLYNSTNSQINSSTTSTSQNYINFSNLIDGIYYYNATRISLLNGNISLETRNITLDSTKPNLSIISPNESSAFGTNTSLTLNFSASDLNLQSCWYNLDNAQNITIPCSNTTFNASDGAHLLNLFANDSAGNIEHKQRNFSIVLGPPLISISAPQNNSNLNNNFVDFIYTPTDIDLNSCQLWGNFTQDFILNQTNISLTSGQQSSFSLILPDRFYEWAILCNDSAGNSRMTENSSFVVDTIIPSLIITEPIGSKSSRNNIPLIFTASDANLQNCWFNVQRGASQEIQNTTISCSTDQTFNVTIDADFILNFYVNDSAGNINHSFKQFTVTTPSVNPGGSGGSSSSSSSSSGGGGAIIKPKNSSQEIGIGISLESLAIKRGTTLNAELEIINNERFFINNCKLKLVSPLSGWIQNNQSKGLATGEKFKFILEVKVPNDAEVGGYNDKITIQCDEGFQTYNANMVVFRNSFEVRIIDYERKVDALNIRYSIEEFAKENHDIALDFKLLNFEGITVAEGQEKFQISPNFIGERNLEFALAKDVVGEYDFKMVLTDTATISEAERKILIPSKSFLGLAISENNRRTLSWFGLAVVSIIILFFLGQFLYKKYKQYKLLQLTSNLESKHGKKLIKLDLKEKPHIHHTK